GDSGARLGLIVAPRVDVAVEAGDVDVVPSAVGRRRVRRGLEPTSRGEVVATRHVRAPDLTTERRWRLTGGFYRNLEAESGVAVVAASAADGGGEDCDGERRDD